LSKKNQEVIITLFVMGDGSRHIGQLLLGANLSTTQLLSHSTSDETSLDAEFGSFVVNLSQIVFLRLKTGEDRLWSAYS